MSYFYSNDCVYKFKNIGVERVSIIVLKQLPDGSEYTYSDNSIKLRKGKVEVSTLCDGVYRIMTDDNLLHVMTDVDMNIHKVLSDHVTRHVSCRDNGCYFQSHSLPVAPSRNYISYTTSMTRSPWTKLFVHDCQRDELRCFGHYILDNVKYFSTKCKLILILIVWLFKNRLCYIVLFRFVCDCFDDWALETLRFVCDLQLYTN